MNQPSSRRIAAYTALTLAYLGVMLVMAVMPLPGIGASTNTSMYFLHALEFFILAVLLFGFFSSFKPGHPYLFTLLLILAIGMLTETMQLFVSYRSFSLLDLLADFVGGSFILARKAA
jgi:VanZ family protein